VQPPRGRAKLAAQTGDTMTDEQTRFTWDIENEADRKKYFWPYERVMAWWRMAPAQGWCRREGAGWTKPVGREPRDNELVSIEAHGWDHAYPEGWLHEDPWAPNTDEDRALEQALAAKGLSWWTACGADADGTPLLWDPFHLPVFHPETGEPTDKHPDSEQWDAGILEAFQAALWARMGEGDANHRKAPLQGIVVHCGLNFAFPEEQDKDDRDANPALYVDLSRSLFGHAIVVSRRCFGGDASSDATRGLFLGCSFQGAGFRKRAVFQGAGFQDTADFRGAGFQGWADFQGAGFQGWADFEGAGFQGYADFEGAGFQGPAHFRGAGFQRYAHFRGAGFQRYADFEGAGFRDTADFRGAGFRDTADFRGAGFRGTADFTGATFLSSVSFDLGPAVPDEKSGMREAVRHFRWPKEQKVKTFDQIEHLKIVSDLNDEPDWQAAAAFSDLTFEGALFLDTVSFQNRKFGERTNFSRSVFAKAPAFFGAIFHRDTNYLNTAFFPAPGAPMRRGRFSRTLSMTKNWILRLWHTVRRKTREASGTPFLDLYTEVAQRVDTELNSLRKNSKNTSDPTRAKLINALSDHANALLDLVRSDHAMKSATKDEQDTETKLRETIIKKPDTLKDLSGPKHFLFTPVLKIESLALGLATYRDAQNKLRHPTTEEERIEATDDAAAAEKAFQTLKIAAENNRSHTDQQIFFALELKSRRKRKDARVGWPEKLFSYAYEFASDFGQSVTRPLFHLFVTIPGLLIFAYWALIEGRFGEPMPWSSDFFWSVFLPSLNPLTSTLEAWDTMARALCVTPPDSLFCAVDPPIEIEAVATLHRILVLVLFFLLGLAIRRRFQIT